MTDALAAEKGERTEGRLGYRSGYYRRALITRVGTLELRVPQDRAGRFSTELFERYQRSEKALVGTLAEMYVQCVSTRKVKAVTEALCGHSFSASSISALNKTLDESLKAFSERRLSDAYPYLILDARYERIREGGIITNQAVLIAVAVRSHSFGAVASAGLSGVEFGMVVRRRMPTPQSRDPDLATAPKLWLRHFAELDARNLAVERLDGRIHVQTPRFGQQRRSTVIQVTLQPLPAFVFPNGFEGAPDRILADDLLHPQQFGWNCIELRLLVPRRAVAQELPLPWPRHRALAGVDLELQLRLQKRRHCRHHACARRFASDVDVTVVRITAKPVSPAYQFAVKTGRQNV